MQRKCACGAKAAGPSETCDACARKRRLQTKLRIGAPGDRYQREADRIAERVMQERDRSAARRHRARRSAEVYYRSCQAFQGEKGQEFAKASTTFWRSEVLGHTKLIGLSQPGKRSLKPCQEPYWSIAQGLDEEAKKPKKDPHTKPK